MAKTLIVTLEIEVDGISEEFFNEECHEQVTEADLDPNAYEPRELAQVVQSLFFDEYVREGFAGSGMFVTFAEKPNVVESKWK